LNGSARPSVTAAFQPNKILASCTSTATAWGKIIPKLEVVSDRRQTRVMRSPGKNLRHHVSAGLWRARKQRQSREWFRQAAEQGLASGPIQPGVMYQHGTGVGQRRIEGLAWFILAAASGDRISIEYRDQTESALGRDATLAAVQRSNKNPRGNQTRRGFSLTPPARYAYVLMYFNINRGRTMKNIRWIGLSIVLPQSLLSCLPEPLLGER